MPPTDLKLTPNQKEEEKNGEKIWGMVLSANEKTAGTPKPHQNRTIETVDRFTGPQNNDLACRTRMSAKIVAKIQFFKKAASYFFALLMGQTITMAIPVFSNLLDFVRHLLIKLQEVTQILKNIKTSNFKIDLYVCFLDVIRLGGRAVV